MLTLSPPSSPLSRIADCVAAPAPTMAALQSQYKQAIDSPTADAFAAEAAIHYLPTLTSIHGGPTIVQHLQTQQKQLTANHKFLNVIEADRSLCVEAETTIEFHEGAGAYLPGLDENFVTDRIATFPTVHIVTFDSSNKILQTRISWDQASVLKAVEVIGARARQWPIRDGKDQSRLISSSIAGQQGTSEPSTRRQSRVVGANGDKYTSLNLFEKPQAPPRESSPAHRDIAPRASAKPAPRDYHDLFAAGVEDLSVNDRPGSPTKEYHNAIKSGAGKHYKPIRLFEEDEEETEALKSPERGIKTNPQKYEHFEFGEKPFVPSEQPKPKHGKHLSQWSFEDFVTPQKPRAPRPETANLSHAIQSQRDFGWSDDEEAAAKPDKFLPHVPAPRPDAEAHFEFNDEATPRPGQAADVNTTLAGGKKPAPARANGLYQDNVMSDEGRDGDAKEPLGNITNKATQAAHKKNFSSHFDIQDDSPGSSAFLGKDENAGVAALKKKPEVNARVNKSLESHWEMRDESPIPEGGRIKIAGDGMGNRKTEEKSWWEYE
ncbi:hypothetical protein FH972_023921 [Carpinus fangiana]|uniref:NTF2 domain-containing protein n=1 Tax=Carpinus fangiana TaxID=176857 RepID=A0A5N6KX20_9ROSI|nr:hypothetical protein FH972_023921 [Carpinus fangiana]